MAYAIDLKLRLHIDVYMLIYLASMDWLPFSLLRADLCKFGPDCLLVQVWWSPHWTYCHVGDSKEVALPKRCSVEALLLCYHLAHHFCLASVVWLEVYFVWHGDCLRLSSAVEKKYLQRMRSPHWETAGMLGVLSLALSVSSLCFPTVEGHLTVHFSVIHFSGVTCRCMYT